MRVTRLDLRNLRCFEQAQILPGAGINVLAGNNGAGKTSLLEALHLMAYGRSFRGRVRDGLVRSGADALEVFVEWTEHGSPGLRKAGLRHAGQAWHGRLDGESVAQLSQLCSALAVVSFEPGSHALIDGGGEPRRRFLDWGLFHVEHDFLPVWRRFNRALKQRNALLKAGGPDHLLDSWDFELAEAGERLAQYRQAYLARLQPQLDPMLERLAPSLGRGEYRLGAGWKRDAMSLADALLWARHRDRAIGHTTVGPHRADWRIELSSAPNGETPSRGQAKLLALSCVMAQARLHALESDGDWPVVLLDDLASELDSDHQHRVLDFLLESDVQVFLTGTQVPGRALDAGVGMTVFHVERGRVTLWA